MKKRRNISTSQKTATIYYAFTIVELLVVIVVIGILAAITIVSYVGLSNRAIGASIQSDLNNDANLIKLYQTDYGSFPTSFDANNCPLTPSADTKYCLKYSQGATVAYGGTSNSFVLLENKNGISYQVTNKSGVVSTNYPSLPIVVDNTFSSVTNTSALLGTTVLFNGGSAITDSGICWGTSSSPTTNCQSVIPGNLNSLAPAVVAAGAASSSVAITPDGTSVYVTNYSSNNVIMYNRNTSSGILTPLVTPTISAGTNPQYIAVSSDNKSVYVANTNSNNISVYSRNISTGALTLINTVAISGMCAAGVAVSPDGLSVYATNGNTNTVTRYNRNISTGDISLASNYATDNTPQAIAISPDGKSLYIGSSASNMVTEFSRSTVDGSLSSIGSISTSGIYPFGLAVSPDGKSVYAVNTNSNNMALFSRNTTSGILSAMSTPTIATGLAPKMVVVAPDGKSVYVTNFSSNSISMFSRNTSDGSITSMSIPTVATGSSPFWVAISSDNNSVYAANINSNNVSQYSRDNSGNLNVITQNRTGLPANTTIYFRGFATNSVGTGYSNGFIICDAAVDAKRHLHCLDFSQSLFFKYFINHILVI